MNIVLCKYVPIDYNLRIYPIIIVPIFDVCRTIDLDIYLEQNIQNHRY